MKKRDLIYIDLIKSRLRIGDFYRQTPQWESCDNQLVANLHIILGIQICRDIKFELQWHMFRDESPHLNRPFV